jgi:predicted N-acetyltransferase YhbS
VNNNYIIRRANSARDAEKLQILFTKVFHPDDVGTLAAIMFNHLPGMENKYWFIVEDKTTGIIISAFALIPWVWELEGLRLKVAEMGIVGTLEEYRGQGLVGVLNEEFDKTLAEENFDIAVIQGIPGFYDQFGYSYSVPLENHINLPLHVISQGEKKEAYTFRLAGVGDIPFLMKEDESYRAYYSLSSFRDEAHWKYMLTEGLKTEYGSAYWIMEDKEKLGKYYCRIPEEGFGTGLIISEISENIGVEALKSLFSFCKEKAIAQDKPYIRLNLHNHSTAGRMAISMGAKEGTPYAWQIKIPDIIRFLRTITPILEKRIQTSSFKDFSGKFRVDFFKTGVDMIWRNGALKNIKPGEGECQMTFSINPDHFPALSLGHRRWQELRYIKPNIFPNSGSSALFIETLFPSKPSWIYEQY